MRSRLIQVQRSWCCYCRNLPGSGSNLFRLNVVSVDVCFFTDDAVVTEKRGRLENTAQAAEEQWRVVAV